MARDPLLRAINSCLIGIGESPVSSSDDPSMDVSIATEVIERVNEDLQAGGWWFNKEENWKIKIDPVTGYMTPPVNAISILNNDKVKYQQLTIRSGRIYDVDNHTYDLRTIAGDDGVISFTFILQLELADTPPVYQATVNAVSRRQFAQDLEVDPSRWNFQKSDEDQAMALLYREDGRNAKRNYLRDSPAAQTLNALMGGTGLTGFPQRNLR